MAIELDPLGSGLLPNPFNEVADLVLRSGFEQGASNGQQSVREGTFDMDQFETALREARREIYRKTEQTENDEFDADRYDELKEAERYLATARLWPNYGARMALKFPESNASSVDGVFSGPDTPAPLEKARAYIDFFYQRLRRMGLELLESPSTRWALELGELPTTDPYPCLAAGVYSTANSTSCCEYLS